MHFDQASPKAFVTLYTVFGLAVVDAWGRFPPR
jgi:hypothetical protein